MDARRLADAKDSTMVVQDALAEARQLYRDGDPDGAREELDAGAGALPAVPVTRVRKRQCSSRWATSSAR